MKDFDLANAYAIARDLRQRLHSLEERIAREADQSPITVADERRMADLQARANSIYTQADRHAPAPLPLERPDTYRRRLAKGLQEYSPKWRSADLSALDDVALDVIEQQIFADAAANSKTHGLKPGEIVPRKSAELDGHVRVDYVGGEGAWFGHLFTRPPQRALLKSQGEYDAMTRADQLSRISEIIRHRPVPAPRVTF